MGSKAAYVAWSKENPLTTENVFQYSDAKDMLKQTGAKPGAFRTKDLQRLVRKFNYQKNQYEQQMEQFRQKQRRTNVSRGAVQRRAFFESPEPQMAGGLRTTTGAS